MCGFRSLPSVELKKNRLFVEFCGGALTERNIFLTGSPAFTKSFGLAQQEEWDLNPVYHGAFHRAQGSSFAIRQGF